MGLMTLPTSALSLITDRKEEGGLLQPPSLVDMTLSISVWTRHGRTFPIRFPNGSLRCGLVQSALLGSAKAGPHPAVKGER
jgi:hypothetical protein